MRHACAIAAACMAVSCAADSNACREGTGAEGVLCLSRATALDDGGDHALMDFDGDGASDLVAVHEGFTRFWHNRGDATFESHGEVTETELGGTPLVLHDLDQDGIDELAVIGDLLPGVDTRTISIFERDPAGALVLQLALDVPLSQHTHGLVLGDFDGDGATDLAVNDEDALVLLLRRDEGFATPIELEPFGIDPDGAIAPRVADLDGDGADELCHPWGDNLRIKTGPELRDERVVPWSSEITDAVLGDIDADGRAEVVAWWVDTDTRLHGSVLRYDAGALVEIASFQHDSFFVLLADLDDDGSDDLVLPGEAVKGKSTHEAWWTAEAGRVRLADGLGGFGEAVRIEGLGGASWAAAHLDEDGRLDLAELRWPPEPRAGAGSPSYAGALLSMP